MEETVAAGTVGGDREGVAGGVGELDVGVLLDTQVATGRRLTIKGGRQHTMLDRHPFGATVEKHIKAVTVPWSDELAEFVRGELDGRDDAMRAESEDLRGGIRVEDVQRVVRRD